MFKSENKELYLRVCGEINNIKDGGVPTKRKTEMTVNADGAYLSKSSLKPVLLIRRVAPAEMRRVGPAGDKQTDKTIRWAQNEVEGLTESINVYLIVHCSVVVSPLHPAKWLLINQPDLLLSRSADRLLASRRCWTVIDPVRMTKDHQELLKHNRALSASVSLSLSLCLSRCKS